MLRRWFSRRSMLAKMVIILVLTIVIAGTLTLGLMTQTVSAVVTAQVNDGTQNILDVAVNQLGSFTSLSNSILISLQTDNALQRVLQTKPNSIYEQQLLSNRVQDILGQAYYLLSPNINIAIVSQYDDVYANWTSFNAAGIAELKREYLHKWEQGSILRYSISAALVQDISLTSGGSASPADYYIQYMPLQSSDSRAIIGVAMVLIPERKLYETVRFTQEEIHTTFVIDQNGFIVSARDRELLGQPLAPILEAADPMSTLCLTSEAGYRERLSVVDIISEHYVREQTWQIVGRVVVYTACSMLAIMTVCYFIMRGITRPLVRLTEKMVARDYNTFVRDNAANLGRNEIALLERGFEVMGVDIEQLIILNREKERQKRQIELAALQSQIQPHFLFNTLNTVRCSIINQHNDKAADLVFQLTMLLRMTLVKGDEMISLRQELENVGYYLGIIRMRHATLFEYEEKIDPHSESLPLPKLLLQPVVENCIVHGFAQTMQGGVIHISTVCEEAFWYIRVRNNGAVVDREIDLRGAKITTADRFSGIGTVNVNNRLKLYFGEDSGLRVYADSAGWTVTELKIAYPKPTEREEGESEA